MVNKAIKYYVICLTLLIIMAGVILYACLPDPIKTVVVKEDPAIWVPPALSTLINSPESDLILYGKDLILHTSKYLGPKGAIAVKSNGMNCGNCHLDAGTRLNGNSFAAVASTYPKFRNRSGKLESIEFRINDCFERSLNGKGLDSLSREMRAMVAYIKWLGKDVPKNVIPKWAGIPKLELLKRAADCNKGKQVYLANCIKCHGVDGQGKLNTESTGFMYPPVWGTHSFNVSAGIYRISPLAGFVKYNMPFTTVQTDPKLSDDEAWDVAAYVISQQRPVKFFKEDWPKIETKPVDYPYGPFADSLSVTQHKYGPFPLLKNKKQGK